MSQLQEQDTTGAQGIPKPDAPALDVADARPVRPAAQAPEQPDTQPASGPAERPEASDVTQPEGSDVRQPEAPEIEPLQGTETHRPESQETHRLVLEAAALPGSAAVPAEILIAPWGQVASANGQFVVDDESARLAIAAFRQHGTDIPIDYEHQSLGGEYASPNGQAPAAGWIRELRAAPPQQETDRAEPLAAGLYGRVEWTQAALARLAAREYRYLSPVVLVRKRDRRVVALHSAALTNKPAIAGMKPIVNREPAGGTTEQASESRTYAGGAPGPQAAIEAALVPLRVRLGLADDADAAAVLAAAESRLAGLEREASEHAAEERIAAAMRAGKLTPGMRHWATTLALKDPEAFDSWAAAAPVVVMLGRTQPPGSRGESRTREAIAASARAAFRADSNLALLTSEEAWVADALRQEAISG